MALGTNPACYSPGIEPIVDRNLARSRTEIAIILVRREGIEPPVPYDDWFTASLRSTRCDGCGGLAVPQMRSY